MDFTHLNPFAVSGLLITATSLPLSIILFFHRKSKTSMLYAFKTLSVSIWGIGSFLIGITTDLTLAKIFLKFAYGGAIFIPIFFAHTLFVFLRKNFTSAIIIIYTLGALFLTLTLSEILCPTPQLVFNSFYLYKSSPTFLIFFIFWTLTAIIPKILFVLAIKRGSYHEPGLILFILGSAVSFAGGILNFLPSFDIMIYPYGNFLVSIYPLTSTYVLLKHDPFNSRIVKRSLVYTILAFATTALYLSSIILLEKILQHFLRYQSISLSIIVAFLIGLLFFPLRNQIQRIIDRFMFTKTPEELAKENTLLKQEVQKIDQLRSIATLASGLAHEVKNPLTTIKTFADYLPQKLDDKEFLLKFSRLVTQDVNRIDDLVHQLLEYAKPSPPQFKQTEINKLLHDTVEFLNNQLVSKSIQLNTDLTQTTDLIMLVDPKQIRQALLNILMNSIEAMPRGGTLTIWTRNKGIKELRSKGNKIHGDKGLEDLRSKGKTPSSSPQFPNSSIPLFLEISITDTGCGIDKKDLPHIFDPFFTKKDQGTGLGLAITHQIITEHRGKILTRSTPGEGTCFIVELPLTESPKRKIA